MDERLLLDLVRDSIASEFNKQDILSEKYESLNELHEKRATFVTINLDGQLRGCIGSLTPYRTLGEDIISNAKAAAFEDPRFFPLSQEEFERAEFELSILSVPEILEYSDIEDLKAKIRVNIDGVILKLENRQATFLPSVWEMLPNFEIFFSHLCQKAGFEPNCLESHPTIYTYQTDKIKGSS